MKSICRIIIKPSCLLMLLCFLFQKSYGQDDAPFNKISVSVLNPLHFAYNNASELLSPKVVHNALELGIKIKQENTNVYAQASFTGPTLQASNLLALQLTSKNSSDAIVNSSAVELSEAP